MGKEICLLFDPNDQSSSEMSYIKPHYNYPNFEIPAQQNPTFDNWENEKEEKKSQKNEEENEKSRKFSIIEENSDDENDDFNFKNINNL